MNQYRFTQRDNKNNSFLEQLRDLGNSLVSRDKDMIERADYVIDIGPKGKIWR
jgi:excinuclease ABC subunit A